MEIREFAERVLFGARLEDKLLNPGPPSALSDASPGSGIGAVTLPGRPPALALDADREKVPFPSLATLDAPRARGRVLHFFANHELLAMELMALALLRFPDAPEPFRRGIVGTLMDEQRHMRLYLQRMEQAGVELGEIPVSRYFWDVIADMSRPIDFVARMSLTFEQANLDYSAYYAEAFETIGDVSTSEVLRQVLADEIAHVRHGAVWFDRWRDPSVGAFDAYQQLLPGLLTPSRAKGRQCFQLRARREAGLSEAFIEAVRLFGGSRGRPPHVYWFNPNCEAEIGEPGTTPKAHLLALAADLETLPCLFAGDDDVVIVSRPVSAELVTGLRTAGFDAPELRVVPPAEPVTLQQSSVGELKPWGQSPAADARFAKLVAPTPWTDARREIYSKPLAADVLRELGDTLDWPDWWSAPDDVGRVATTVDEVLAQLAWLATSGASEAVVKAPFGTSGRGMLRSSGGRLDTPAQRWIERTIARQGAVLVESWLDKVVDLSLQLSVPAPEANAGATVLGLTRFVTDRRGQYLGTLLGKATHGLPRAVLRWLTDDGRAPRRLPETLDRVAAAVTTRLQAAGYRGPAGVDMLIHRAPDGGFRLKPIVEINPRHTMGQVALAITARCAPRTTGLWTIASVRTLVEAGYDTPGSFADRVRSDHPLQVGPRGIRSGILLTSDPSRCTQVVSLAVVDASTERCEATITALGLPWPLPPAGG